MSGFMLATLSPAARASRLTYVITLAVLAAGFGALLRWGSLEGGQGAFSIACFALLTWVFLAALCRRLVDAGRTRWWLMTPFVLAIPAFFAGFALYAPPNPLQSLGDTAKTVMVVTVIPLFGVALGIFFSKIAAGLLSATAVWWGFALLLVIPGSRQTKSPAQKIGRAHV